MKLKKTQLLWIAVLVVVFLIALVYLREESTEIAEISEPEGVVTYQVEQQP